MDNNVYNGCFDGEKIVLDRAPNLVKGQHVQLIVKPVSHKKTKVNLAKYGISTERGRNVEKYMAEMREDR